MDTNVLPMILFCCWKMRKIAIEKSGGFASIREQLVFENLEENERYQFCSKLEFTD